MEPRSDDASPIPPHPPIHSGEIRAALFQAQKLGWTRWSTEDRTRLPIPEMEMEQVLRAAFEYRGGRYNQTLREEAQRLKRQVAAARQELEELGYDRRDVLWAQDMREQLIEFLELVRSTRVIRIAEQYQSLRKLLEQSDPDSGAGLHPEP